MGWFKFKRFLPNFKQANSRVKPEKKFKLMCTTFMFIDVSKYLFGEGVKIITKLLFVAP